MGKAPIHGRAFEGSDGFTMIELLVSVFVLSLGVLGLFTGFESANRLSLVGEREATMAHVAQQKIESLEGYTYATLGLDASSLTASPDPTNPDYYVSSANPQTLQVNRAGTATEQLDFDTAHGTVTPVTSWTEGGLSGSVYQYVTWSTDPSCAGSGCPSTQDYKRITVAVTLSNPSGGTALNPTPVWVSSLLSDPAATSQTSNTSDPLSSSITTCTTGSGASQSCQAYSDTGTANTFYLHDFAATNPEMPTAPTSSHATHQTVGTASGETCSSTQGSAGPNVAGCPTPDLMDSNLPSGANLYDYSTDQGTTGYSGGRLLQAACPGGTACGTDSTADCSGGGWSAGLQTTQSEFWVTPTLTRALTLNGYGALSINTATQGGNFENVSFCLEIYDVPPSGSPDSLADLDAYPPVDLGGAAYVPPQNGATNWPGAVEQLSFSFNFRGTQGGYTVPAGNRIGARIWMVASTSNPIAVVYDNSSYISQLQLNNS